MAKMKILLCHNFYQYRGGEEETLFNQKKALESRGHAVTLFARDNREIESYGRSEKVKAFFRTLFSFPVYRRIEEIVGREKPDVAHVHNTFPLISPSIYFALKRSKIPVVQTVHNYRFLCADGLFLLRNGQVCERCKRGNYLHGVMHRCYRKSYLASFIMAATLGLHRRLKTFVQKVDLLIAPSEFMKQKLLEGGFPEEKIIVRPHFVDTDRLAPGDSVHNYAVYMGRLAKEKGLLTLLEAWKGMSPLGLKILGAGEIQAELKELVAREELANVELLGHIAGQERFEILKPALFLVFPSECYENMPYIILESFACGVPVIASDRGGLRELIDDGKTGYLFEPGNAGELRKKMLALSSDRTLLSKMRGEARKKAVERFTEQTGYDNLMEAYRGVAKT